MNTLIETKTPCSFTKALFKVVANSAFGQVLFLGGLPVVFLFLTLSVSLMSGSIFSIYLPFFVLVNSLVCLRWRIIGLGASYLALALLLIVFFQDIPLQKRFMETGLVFTLAIDFFILFLASGELGAIINQLGEENRVSGAQLIQSQLETKQLKEQYSKLQIKLEGEIKQLKEEAKQRRIEKQHQEKRIELIQSEIELLTSQKEYFIAKARKGDKEHSQNLIDEAKEKIAFLEANVKNRKTDYLQLEGKYKQLRLQFEEKSNVLLECRKELFRVNGKLIEIENNPNLASSASEWAESTLYEKALNSMGEELDELEEEVTNLEELVSHVLSQ